MKNKNKSKNKKIAIIAAWCAAALLVVWAVIALGHFFPVVMRVDDREIPSGLYLLKQLDAYYDAVNEAGLTTAAKKTVLSTRIDGKSASKWIQDTAEKYCMQYIAVQNLAKERKVNLTEQDITNINKAIDENWANAEEQYRANGIALNTWRIGMANDSLKLRLFENMFSGEGEFAPTDEEIQARYIEQNARIRRMSIPLTGPENTPYENPAEIEAMIEEMVAALNSGKDFEYVAEKMIQPLYEKLGRDFDLDTVISGITTSAISYTDKSGVYSAEFLETLRGQNIGDAGSYTPDKSTSATLYQKVEAFGDDEEFQTQRATLLQQLYYADFEQKLAEEYASYNVNKTFGAQTFYRPSRIVPFT